MESKPTMEELIGMSPKVAFAMCGLFYGEPVWTTSYKMSKEVKCYEKVYRASCGGYLKIVRAVGDKDGELLNIFLEETPEHRVYSSNGAYQAFRMLNGFE